MTETTERPVRLYTRARKFPRLIGTTLDGRKLPGGPYTWPQLALAGGVLFVSARTAVWWARGSGLQTIMIILFLTVGAVIVGRQLPQITRNPVLLVGGVLRVLTAPRTGRLANRPLRLRAPHQVKGLCLVDLSGVTAPDQDWTVPEFEAPQDPMLIPHPLEDVDPTPPPAPTWGSPEPTPDPTAAVPLSRVAALLSKAVSGGPDA